MPFCPQCGFEYRDDVLKCSDCDEWLVPELPEEKEEAAETEPVNWIPLASLTSTAMASMLLEALESKEIRAAIHSGSGHFGQIGAMGVNSFIPAGASIMVMVNEEDAVDAVHEAKIILGDDWEKVLLIDVD